MLFYIPFSILGILYPPQLRNWKTENKKKIFVKDSVCCLNRLEIK